MSFIGILLTLVAISPVIAISPVTGAVQNGSFGIALSHTQSAIVPIHPDRNVVTAGNNSFFFTMPEKPVKNRFFWLVNNFTPVKTISPGNSFAFYNQIATGNTRTYTENDNGKTMTVAKGQVVKVRLSENPTTGYRWEPSVSSGIEVAGDTYTRSTPNAIGSGGTRTWTLKFNGTGSQTFDADYKRSWEPGSVDSYSLHFVVA
ncbi:MAG: protease inhibitor I42 family protein [Methanomicrobiales archaeon]|nr:protease inhibitor I42 family protein [Methanomicrobiales archaeon]